MACSSRPPLLPSHPCPYLPPVSSPDSPSPGKRAPVCRRSARGGGKSRPGLVRSRAAGDEQVGTCDVRFRVRTYYRVGSARVSCGPRCAHVLGTRCLGSNYYRHLATYYVGKRGGGGKAPAPSTGPFARARTRRAKERRRAPCVSRPPSRPLSSFDSLPRRDGGGGRRGGQASVPFSSPPPSHITPLPSWATQAYMAPLCAGRRRGDDGWTPSHREPSGRGEWGGATTTSLP